MSEKIKIIKGYLNGTLELSDKGHTRARKGNSLKWKIKDGSDATSIKVASIEIKIEQDPSNIFSIKPNNDEGEWKAEIDKHAADNAECKYSIHWKDCDGNDRIHDPKISIKPSTFNFRKWLIGLILGLLGLLSLEFLRRKRSKK